MSDIKDIIKITEYLTILELPTDKFISEDVLKTQYKKLSFLYHPDTATGRYKDGKRFIKLKEAFDYIKDNVDYVNRMISSEFDVSSSSSYNDYQYQEEMRRRREAEEQRRRDEERRRREAEERKRQEEERKRREAEEKKRQEELKKQKAEAFKKKKEEIISKTEQLSKSIKKENYDSEDFIHANEIIQRFVSSVLSDRFTNIEELTDLYEAMVLVVQKIKTIEQKQRIKLIRRRLYIGSGCLASLVIFIILLINLIIPAAKYNNAMKCLENGEYEKAEELLYGIENYKDASKQAAFIPVYEKCNAGDYDAAITIFEELGEEVNITYDTDGGELESLRLLSTKSYDKAVKNGYKFKDWVLNEYEIQNDNSDYSLHITLKASYELVTYNITYNMDNGYFDNNQPNTYDIEKNVTIPNPSKTGYTFIGWTSSLNEEPSVDTSIPLGTYGDLNFTANWQANSYKITYDVNGGDALSSVEQVVTYDKAYQLIVPIREGYTFLGWNNSLETYTSGIWNETNDVSLKAVWSGDTFRIDYTLNSGINDATNPLEYVADEKEITLKDPSRTGYTFIGWTNSSIIAPTKEVVIPLGSYYNLSFVANWQANSYKITYDVNGGNSLTSNTLSVTYDMSYSLITPTKDGYTFLGWYNSSTKYTSGTWTQTNDLALKALWSSDSYLIQYNLNSGTNNADNPLEYTTDEKIITLKDPSRTGYTFLGWTNSSISTPTKTITIPLGTYGSLSYTANWQANNYTITYDVNGGNVLSSNTLDVTYDKQYSLSTPTKKGYTFLGWYNSSTEYTSSTWKQTNNITLKAMWSVNTYTITVTYNDYEDTAEVTYGTNYSINYTPQENYIFNGFYTGQHGTGTKLINDNLQSISAYDYDQDITIYPFYQYEVTFVLNNGEQRAKTTYKLNDEIVAPEREDVTFECWYLDCKMENKYTEIIGNCTLYAKWEEESPSYYFDFHLQNNEYYQIGYNKDDYTNIQIPMYINDILVKSIEPRCFMDKTKLVSIILPNSITNIGDNAFANCTYLESIIIPDSVTTLGIKAFYNCYSLKTLIIGNGIESIDSGACYGCGSLESITLPFAGASKNATSPGYTTLFGYIFGNTKFSNATKIVQFYSTDRTRTTYSTYDEYEKQNYENYYYGYYWYIPNSIRSVTITGGKLYGSFCNCSRITSISITDDVTLIGDCTFEECTSLTSVKIGSNVTSIGDYAFYRCSALTNIEIGSNVTSFGERSFNDCASIESIIIPDSVDAIGASAFSGCYNLKTINIPSSVTILENSTFAACYNLEDILMSNNIVSFGDYVFANCYKLTEIPVSDNLSTIGKYAFEYCKGFININIPNSVTSIGDYEFYSCENLKSISIGNHLTNIGDYIISKCPELVEITISENNSKYRSEGNCIIETDTNKLVVGCNGSVIPDGVVSIGDHAFSYCQKLKEITIPDSVTIVGIKIFEACNSLRQISIPRLYGMFYELFSDTEGQTPSITTAIVRGGAITDRVFVYCSYIQNVILEDAVTSIGYASFGDCSSLKSIILGNQISSIGNNSFSGCTSLEYISIPETVTHIHPYAFSNCGIRGIIFNGIPVEIYNAFGNTNNLTDVFFSFDTELNVFNNCLYGDNSKLQNANKYFFSEEQNSGYWHFVDGIPVVWE